MSNIEFDGKRAKGRPKQRRPNTDQILKVTKAEEEEEVAILLQILRLFKKMHDFLEKTKHLYFTL